MQHDRIAVGHGAAHGEAAREIDERSDGAMALRTDTPGSRGDIVRIREVADVGECAAAKPGELICARIDLLVTIDQSEPRSGIGKRFGYDLTDLADPPDSRENDGLPRKFEFVHARYYAMRRPLGKLG